MSLHNHHHPQHCTTQATFADVNHSEVCPWDTEPTTQLVLLLLPLGSMMLNLEARKAAGAGTLLAILLLNAEPLVPLKIKP
jgi:hypothetical protein